MKNTDTDTQRKTDTDAAVERTRREHQRTHDAATRPDGTVTPHGLCAICLDLGLQGPAI